MIAEFQLDGWSILLGVIVGGGLVVLAGRWACRTTANLMHKARGNDEDILPTAGKESTGKGPKFTQEELD